MLYFWHHPCLHNLCCSLRAKERRRESNIQMALLMATLLILERKRKRNIPTALLMTTLLILERINDFCFHDLVLLRLKKTCYFLVHFVIPYFRFWNLTPLKTNFVSLVGADEHQFWNIYSRVLCKSLGLKGNVIQEVKILQHFGDADQCKEY